ncbi:MAG: hypothetical protein U9O89_07165 [Thermoproteota archaeon]|nr:hypothetical protein [Thermoproteota archaeon]
MATPKKEEIVERAKQYWHQQKMREGDPAWQIEPTTEELRILGLRD